MELSEDTLDWYFNVHNNKRNLSLFTALDTLQAIATDNNDEVKFGAILNSSVFNQFTTHSEKRLPRNLGATCEMLFLYREKNKRKFAETFGETPVAVFSAISNNSLAKITKRLKSFEL